MSTKGYPNGNFRVSDADRERALSELNEAFQAGRVTHSELDHRTWQILQARTGEELTAPLADLPEDGVLAARAASAERTHRRVLAARITMGGSAVAAVSLAAASVVNAVGTGGGTSPRHQLLREILARQGVSVPAPVAPGFNWAGTFIPAAFAVLLLALIIFLHVSGADRAPNA